MNYRAFTALSIVVLGLATAAACFAIEPIADQGTAQFAGQVYRFRWHRPGIAAARADERKKAAKKEAKDVKAATDTATQAQAQKDADAARADDLAKAKAARIQINIVKDGLAKDDLETLGTRQQTLADLQKSFAKDAPEPTREELKQLFDAVGVATKTLWQARQTGTTTYRLGSSVVIKGTFATKLLTGDITRGEARQTTRDFQQMLADEKDLVGELTPDAREKTQAQYNVLIGRYFETP